MDLRSGIVKKMALSLGDFYGRRTPARRTSSLSRDLNLSLQSQCSSYQPNESLTQRGDLQVQFSDDDIETPFDSLTGNGSGATSTPQSDCRNRYHSPARHTPRSLPPSTSQPTLSSTNSNIVGMLQEQQGLLQKLLHEQAQLTKAVKKNDKRIALMEVTLEKCEDSSSSSSSGEKRRFVTKDLTVSSFY